MSRNNTGNPIGSKAFPDFEDNVKNLDQAVNAEQDTFQDRLGKSRLTWAGIEKAGSGDPAIAVDAAARAEAAASSVEQNAEQIAQDAAQQAVDNVVIAVDGAVGRAEGAADRAEAAADAAFINADVYATVAEGRAAVADGEQFQVVEGYEVVRYRRTSTSTQTEVARYPSAAAISRLEYDGDAFSISGFILSNGVRYEDGSYLCTDFLHVFAEEPYSVKTTNPGTVHCAWYSADKEFISSFKGGSPTAASVIAPSGAAFVRLSTLASDVEDSRFSSVRNVLSLKQLGEALDTGLFSFDSANVRYEGEPLDTVIQGLDTVIQGVEHDLSTVVPLNTQHYGQESYQFNGFINTSGVLQANADYKATGFLLIESQTLYRIVTLAFGSAVCAWYSKDKTLISSFNVLQGQVLEIESPQDAAYVRMSCAIMYLSDQVGITSVSGAFNLVSLKKAIDSLPLDFDSSQVLYNGRPVDRVLHGAESLTYLTYGQDKFIFHGFIIFVNGALSASEDYRATDFLPVISGQSYQVRANTPGNSRCAWYDKDRVFISAFTSNETTGVTVEAPAGAKFLRMSTLESSLSATTGAQSLYPQYSPEGIESALSSGVQLRVDGLDVTPVKVRTVSERNAVARAAYGNNAGTAGARLHDEGLRSDIVSDGLWWRMPDGTPADVAERTEVYPGFDEARRNLENYASSKSVVADVGDLSKWTPSAGARVWQELKKGFLSVGMEFTYGASPSVTFQNGTPLSINRFLLFDLFVERGVGSSALRIDLVDASGSVQYSKTLSSSDMGKRPRAFISNNDHRRFEVDVDTMAPASESSSLSYVTGVRISVGLAAGAVARIWLGEIESASFKPRIVLRFDDARASIYENAYLKMKPYGFTGMVAVHTDGVGTQGTCTLEQLQEMMADGWDMVSHFPSQPPGGMNSLTYKELNDGFLSSKEYLRDIGASLASRSIYISPQGQYNELPAKTAYKYFDVQINRVYLNSLMPRRGEGTYLTGSTWTTMGAFTGDGKNSEDLIGAAQEAINGQGLQIVMMHDILPTMDNPYTVTVADFEAWLAWLDLHRDDIEVTTLTSLADQMRGGPSSA